MSIAILAVSTANLAVSVTAIIVAIRIGRRTKREVDAKVEESRRLVNTKISTVQTALEGLKL